MENGKLRQILLLTDGCSNHGENPVRIAKQAFKAGVTVNVIGILEDYETEESHGFQEVSAIAKAGGGVSQIVYQEDLSKTVQSVTRQAMTQTLQGFVQEELSQIFGKKQTLTEIEPEKRSEVIEVVENLGETCDLDVFILVDTSASMTSKLETVKGALIDLTVNLHARMGDNLFCVHQFPKGRQVSALVHDWAPELGSISHIFPKLITGGMTPTGPAMKQALQAFSRETLRGSFEDAAYDAEGEG